MIKYIYHFVRDGRFFKKDLTLSLLGIASAFICAIVIDKLFLGESQAFIAHIVSEKHEDINKAIIDKLDRTSTILDGTGGYSKEPKKVVMVSFSMREYTTLISIVNNMYTTVDMILLSRTMSDILKLNSNIIRKEIKKPITPLKIKNSRTKCKQIYCLYFVLLRVF